MPTDALSELRKLIAEWRFSAFQSREEAGRIRRTVNIATPAESNCIIRAELWDQCADSLEALLPALEQQERELRKLDFYTIHWTDCSGAPIACACGLSQLRSVINHRKCPICGGIEGCDHSVLERRRAALNPEVTR